MQHFKQMIEEIRRQTDMEKFRKIVEEQGEKLVLFGAGDCGHAVYRNLHDAGISVCCFCDNRQGGHKDEETGIDIVKPEWMKDKITKLVVLICAMEEEVHCAIYEQVTSFGFDESRILLMKDYYDRLPVSYLEEKLQKYENAYQLLEDSFSRRVFLARMKKVYLMGDISEVVSPPAEEYFDEKVILTDQEVFIDCGGFDGDTSVEFIERCGGKYDNIIIFEPELCKKEAIEKNMSGYHYQLYQAGVWSENTRLYFDALETVGSHVSEKESDYVIEVKSLDETVYDKKPTFIKMDIEGSEQEALKGCRRIISDFCPKLAICVYHKPDDLYEIPALIKGMNSDYRLYLRQYASTRHETVLYAI